MSPWQMTAGVMAGRWRSSHRSTLSSPDGDMPGDAADLVEVGGDAEAGDIDPRRAQGSDDRLGIETVQVDRAVASCRGKRRSVPALPTTARPNAQIAERCDTVDMLHHHERSTEAAVETIEHDREASGNPARPPTVARSTHGPRPPGRA